MRNHEVDAKGKALTEDCSIWQHMMDSRYHLKIAANLSNDWGPPLIDQSGVY